MTDATAPLAVIVAGPTASGKSALAMMLAEELNGVVINADSMQVYQELRVLTARPTVEDEAVVPHALYGVRSAAEAGSVAWWRGAALAAMQTAHDAGRLPILCGGTGMYFLSLTQGLSQIPTPSEAARDEARGRLAEFGPSALHADLATVDPKTAARLRPTDGQRLARAWEVWRSSGRGIADWQEDVGEKAPWRFAAIRLDPPRGFAFGNHDPFCGDAGCRRAGRSARIAGTKAGSEFAGDAGTWRSGIIRPYPWGYKPKGSRDAHRTGNRTIHQATGDLVPASRFVGKFVRIYD